MNVLENLHNDLEIFSRYIEQIIDDIDHDKIHSACFKTGCLAQGLELILKQLKFEIEQLQESKKENV